MRLQHDIDAILNAPALSHGFFGVLVKSMRRGETFYPLDASKLMMPASTMKVVTVAAAAERLGWDYRYDTRLFALGPIDAADGVGVLHGDSAAVATGEPSL